MINDTLKKLERKNIIVSIILIVLGILLVAKPIGFIKTIVILMGSLLLVLAIIDFISYFDSDQKINNLNLFKGIVELIAGVLLVFRNDFLIDLFPIILGIILIINSALKLQMVINIKKANNDKWAYGFVGCLLLIFVGIIIIINPFRTLELVIRIIGIILIVSELFSLIYNNVIIRKVTKTLDSIETKNEKVIEAEVVTVKEETKKTKRKKKDE